MRRELRLRHRKDFESVYKRGRTRANELLVLRTLPNGLDRNRYGFVTSKRVGKAVVRNRVRRRLREAVRLLPLKTGWDVVASAKVLAAGANYQELRKAVVELLAEAGLLDREALPEEQGL